VLSVFSPSRPQNRLILKKSRTFSENVHPSVVYGKRGRLISTQAALIDSRASARPTKRERPPGECYEENGSSRNSADRSRDCLSAKSNQRTPIGTGAND